MLSLRLGQTIIQTNIMEGGQFQLPNGGIVSPAYAGWIGPEGHELIQSPDPAPAPLTTDDVNIERDRRMYGTFTFMGKPYDSDRDSLQRIAGTATMASLAIGAGAQPGDVYWTGRLDPFSWISADNTLTTMDAFTAIAFGQAAAAHVEAHIFAARTLKNMDPIPLDYTDAAYWP